MSAVHRPDLADWRKHKLASLRQAHVEQRHGDRPRDDLGSMRVIVWVGLILALMLVSSCVISVAYAAEPLQVHIIAHGLSKHAKKTSSTGHPYNENNPGAGLRLDGDWMPKSTAIQVGHYYNSYRRHSTYAVVDWLPLKKETGPAQISAGAFLGVVNGYPWADGRWAPAAGVMARAQISRFSVAVRASPGKGSKGVAALEIGIQL